MLGMIDLAMDLCALCAVQLGFGALRWKRLLLAELVLMAGTLMCALLGPPGMAMRAAVIVLTAAALVDARRIRHVFEAAVCLTCTFAAGAGLAELAGNRAALAPAGMLMLMWLTRRRRNGRWRWNVDLYVELDGQGDWVRALIDTGNRLRDGRSGLGVLIVEAAAAPNFTAAALRREAGGEAARVLSFGVLGSGGKLRCYRPDRVELRLPGRAPQSAPPCLVGTFPGRIPGFTRALAPPEFADAANGAHGLRGPGKSILRRY